MSVVDRAREFATAAHRGQYRKYTNEPYIVHPGAVASIVATVPHTPEMLAAAWLHDVVEDTPVTSAAIVRNFGYTVGLYVLALTDVSRPEDGNRAARKAIDRAHIAGAPSEAKTIKLADLIDNTRSIVENDAAFARVYLAEKRALLEVLTEGAPVLWQRAHAIAYMDYP